MFKAYKIAEDIYWVGVIEWNERYIHGFSMPHGSTNNCYLINDEHPTLIDTCTPGFEEELLGRIKDIINPMRIEYIVSNHSEKDHAGTLGKILDAMPSAKVITSDPKGHAILTRYYGQRNFVAVKSGDEISIGKRTLKFIHTPMVHWPDNMVTYSIDDKILFSNDAFGQFLATSQRFDDEIDESEAFASAKKYFANIVMPFSKQTAKAVAAVRELKLNMIAPSHGVIWRKNVNRIIDIYDKWTKLEPTNSAVVAYSSMYGATKLMAQAITEAFMSCGVKVRMYDLQISDISDVMTEVMDAKYIAIGSSTHNKTVLPPTGEFLTYLKGLTPKGRIGISFGSYGWAATGEDEIASVMSAAGYVMPIEPITADWTEDIEGANEIFNKITSIVKD